MAAVEQQGLIFGKTKLGEVTVTKKWVVDTEEEIETVGREREMGMPEDDRTSSQLEGPGRFEVVITYKGIREDTPAANEKWSGRVVLREDPIETFPFFDLLKEQYGGVLDEKGKVEWPEFLPAGRTGGSGLPGPKSGAAARRINPMFGTKTYPVATGEISHKYLRTQLPADLLDRVGRVLDSLPGNAGVPTPAGYCWVTRCPEFDRDLGEAWSITDHYLLVPKDGYLAIISGLIGRPR